MTKRFNCTALSFSGVISLIDTELRSEIDPNPGMRWNTAGQTFLISRHTTIFESE